MADAASRIESGVIDVLKNVNFPDLMQTFGAEEARPRKEPMAQAQAARAR